MDRAGKPIAVICHGRWLLISAGLAKGRRITSWPTLQDDLRNAGAEWEDKECIRDLFAEMKPGKSLKREREDAINVRS